MPQALSCVIMGILPIRKPALMTMSSALSLLKPGDVCILFLTDGSKRTGRWNPLNRGFHLCDGRSAGFVSKDYVEEWIPSGLMKTGTGG